MSQEWNIRSRGHVCSFCQKPLVDRAPVVSALRETTDGYERFDCHRIGSLSPSGTAYTSRP